MVILIRFWRIKVNHIFRIIRVENCNNFIHTAHPSTPDWDIIGLRSYPPFSITALSTNIQNQATTVISFILSVTATWKTLHLRKSWHGPHLLGSRIATIIPILHRPFSPSNNSIRRTKSNASRFFRWTSRKPHSWSPPQCLRSLPWFLPPVSQYLAKSWQFCWFWS